MADDEKVFHSAAGFVSIEESDRLNGIHPQQHIIDAQAKNRAKRKPTWWEQINRWNKHLKRDA